MKGICLRLQTAWEHEDSNPGQCDCKVGPFFTSSDELGGRKKLRGPKVRQFPLTLPRVICTVNTLTPSGFGTDLMVPHVCLI